MRQLTNTTGDNYGGGIDMEVRGPNSTKGETYEGEDKRHLNRFSDGVADSLRGVVHRMIKLTKKTEL